MKRLLLCLVLAFGWAGAAAAQPAVLVKSKPIQGTVPDFRSDFPPKVTRWADEETERQFQAPTPLFDLEFAMMKELEPELQRIAKRKKLSLEEVEVLVMHDVITGAAKKMDKIVRARRQEVEKAGIPDKQDPQLRALGARKAGLLALIQELAPRMTSNTRLLTSAK